MKPIARVAAVATTLVVTGCTATANAPVEASIAWVRQAAPLTTPWTEEVSPDNTLPDYPRPQMVRTNWLNLNGVWNYLGRSGSLPSDAVPPSSAFGERILVPFPAEAALSGIGRRDDEMWYQRLVEVPSSWRGQRVLLHFGAVDQVATVWVNQKQVARHEGGYTAFSVDITAALRESAGQEITVRVQDRNEAGPFPVGKQRNQPAGLFYTGSSGIWQTVWMEPVPAAHIDKLDITQDLRSLTVSARTSGTTDERAVVFVSEPGGRVVVVGSGRPGQPIPLVIPQPRLWSPDDPYLYNITVVLARPTGEVVDEVSSYAGLRTVGIVTDPQGRPRITLNGQITFLHGPLDQGYWPDGIYTAPTDQALKSDLEWIKKLGMNFVRKHAKVEPARWYHWTDRLGLLVWQDMPSLDVNLQIPVGPAPEPVRAAKAHFERELLKMVDQLRSVTSIVGWVPFNEGWGEFDTARIADTVKATDPTRLVNANSGVNCCKSLPDSGAGDVFDDHTYVGPGRPAPAGSRVLVDGEYGGLGLVPEGNRWPGLAQSYEIVDNPARLTERYVEVSRDLEDIVRQTGLSGAIYTQMTDVENEVNGFLTYDRRLAKMDVATVAERNRAVIAAGSQANDPAGVRR